MKIIAIVASTPQGVIGKNGTIPWYFPEDLQRFKEITMGHTVIMGRKTFESLGGKPLRGRFNIVLTSSMNFTAADPGNLAFAGSMEEAIDIARWKDDECCFLIGGTRVYEEGLPLCDSVLLTQVNMEIPEGEAFFPVEQVKKDFDVVKHTVVNSFLEYIELERKRDSK